MIPANPADREDLPHARMPQSAGPPPHRHVKSAAFGADLETGPAPLRRRGLAAPEPRPGPDYVIRRAIPDSTPAWDAFSVSERTGCRGLPVSSPDAKHGDHHRRVHIYRPGRRGEALRP